MSKLHVNQLLKHVEQRFDGLIDMTDFANRPDDQRRAAFLSRGLAAFVLTFLAQIADEDAAKCITDGFGDNGIDAVYSDTNEKILYLIQTKWNHEGKGSVERGDCLKFIAGVKDIIDLNFDRFNKKLLAKQNEIEAAMSDTATRISLVIAYTGQAMMARDTQGDFDRLLHEINDTSEILTFRPLGQKAVYDMLVRGSASEPIDLEIVLQNWNQHQEPYEGFFGDIAASDVADWYEKYGLRLFEPNIRSYLGDTEVNQAISTTLEESPEHFWYLNNGITSLCRSIRKKPVGGVEKATGLFDCKGVVIVNGAQTVGAIAETYKKSPARVTEAKVHIRFISLEKCPDTFASDVTRATNTQNRVESRDFASFDPNQDRLKKELRVDGIEYVYRSGEKVADLSRGFDIVDAAAALACAHHDVSYAVILKNRFGRIWENTDRPPYTDLFTDSLTGRKLWGIVRIYRLIETVLRQQQSLRTSREKMVAIHGNRFLAHQIYKRVTRATEDTDFVNTYDMHTFEAILSPMIGVLEKEITKRYPSSIIPNVFKNQAKCRELNTSLTKRRFKDDQLS